jgi:hypothetical protein
MTVVEEITELLKQKQQIDRQQESVNNMGNYDDWVLDALVLLLRAALEQQMQMERNNA